MPCNSMQGYTPSPSYGEMRKEIARLEAMLCALIKVTGLDKVLAEANWEEAGVDGAELLLWWQRHQEKDAKR